MSLKDLKFIKLLWKNQVKFAKFFTLWAILISNFQKFLLFFIQNFHYFSSYISVFCNFLGWLYHHCFSISIYQSYLTFLVGSIISFVRLSWLALLSLCLKWLIKWLLVVVLLELLALLPASQLNPLLNRDLWPCYYCLWQEHYYHLSSMFNPQMTSKALIHLIFHSLSLIMIFYLHCQTF